MASPGHPGRYSLEDGPLPDVAPGAVVLRVGYDGDQEAEQHGDPPCSAVGNSLMLGACLTEGFAG